MIDYEITVNVRNLTQEEKKRAQDAFFKLGITWWDGTNYSYLDKEVYTNTTWLGEVLQNLMWADDSTEPTHTINELLELAGMKTDTKPFDLEKALKGEPVVLRDGSKAYVRHHETELDVSEPLIGYTVLGVTVDTLQWTECGHYLLRMEESEYDIVGMWVEPPVFDHWDLLNEDIEYLAKNGNERWYGYSVKPTKDEEGWIVPRYGKCYSVTGLNPTSFPDCDWENSLMERPEND